jgi:hypothetical protein
VATSAALLWYPRRIVAESDERAGFPMKGCVAMYGSEPGRRWVFDGVAVGDDGSARAYECVVAIASDGSWTFDWHWMTGEPHSLVWHGPGGPVGDFLRSIVEGSTRSSIRASA